MAFRDSIPDFPALSRLTFVTPISLVLVLLINSACASGPPSYRQNIQSAIGGGGSVSVVISDDGTVILNGWVEDTYTMQAVLRAARKDETVTRVVNNIRLSAFKS